MILNNAQTCFDLVKHHFKDDASRAIDWFHEFNMDLGGIRPIEMLNNRESDKLLKFIRSRLDVNSP